MIVYLARDIPALAMYCVSGESGSSLHIESTDSMNIISMAFFLIRWCLGFVIPMCLIPMCEAVVKSEYTRTTTVKIENFGC